VRQFAEALACEASTENCILLVRPHPLNYKIWQTGVPLPDNARIYPDRGDLPDNPESIDIYCHSIYYSKAMVGLNTSAFLEASVLNRSCVALPTMEGCYDQARFGHFRHLANGNFIHKPKTHAEAASLLATMLETREDARTDARLAFVHNFLRPNGIEREAADVMLEAIVGVAQSPTDRKNGQNFFVQRADARLDLREHRSIVYVLIGLAHFPYHESVISGLSRAGFHIHLVILKLGAFGAHQESFADDSPAVELTKAFRQFCQAHTNVNVMDVSKRVLRATNWSVSIRFLRSFASYIRRQPSDNFYRRRWLGYMREHLGASADSRWLHWLLSLPGVERFLGWIDLCLPSRTEIKKLLGAVRPGMVFVSPGDMRYSQEVEWLKTAKRLGIRTGIVTLSWDNLTTKGLIHIRPDYLFVWNDSNAKEAKVIHHMPEAGTFVVGAPFFDKWYSTEHMVEAREGFLPSIGLNPARRYIVYLGSSANVANNESWLIRDLHAELVNAADPTLSDLQIYVRPHPGNRKICADLTDLPIVLADDEIVGIPFSDSRKRVLFNTLYHAELTVSLNTSAILDAIAIGKPCISIRTDRYRDTHTGADHFCHLLAAGAVIMADGVDQCTRIISEHLAGADPSRAQRQSFARRFIFSGMSELNAGESVARITGRLFDGETASAIKEDIVSN
jgi:hypothetical protein